MPTPERIEIPVNKKSCVQTLLITLGFIAISVWMVHQPPEETIRIGQLIHLNVNGFGYFSLALWGGCGLVSLYFLLQTRPWLILDEAGIMDNVRRGAVPVRWADITEVRVIGMFLSIKVRNPEEYIAREKSLRRQRTMRQSLEKYGTPIFFNPQLLAISLEKLDALVVRKWCQWQAEQESAPPPSVE